MSESSFPQQGMSPDDVMARMEEMARDDADWRGGKTWSLVYFAEDELTELMKKTYSRFISCNGLSPMAFPSLRQFEADVVGMGLDLLHGGPAGVGTMTSGGSESILMAIKAARDKMRVEKGISEPEMILPITVHPAFEKAAHYFGVKAVHIPVDDDWRADVAAARAALNENTILVVGSAPNYPTGVVDPIPELAALAAEHGICCHVDACLGGYILPHLRAIGYEVPPFDFEVPGVTSISADLHKYGYAARGASTVLYRDDSYRKYQFFAYTDWPGGLYASPSMLGSRPGGAIAAAWAALTYLGAEGYQRLARVIMDTTQRLREGINAIPELEVMGNPVMGVFAFTGDGVDIYNLGEAMKEKGWQLDAQHLPPALHMMVTPAHEGIVEQFLTDLRDCVEVTKANASEARAGVGAIYGMAGSMTDRTPVRDLLIEVLGQILPARG